MPRRLVVELVGATLLLTACGPVATSTALTPTSPTSVAPSPSPESPPSVRAALADAAQHIGVPVDQLRVEQLQATQWPDSALGCPRPGMMYSQIVTPGYLVVISGAGKLLEYHTDAGSRVVLCKET